MRGQVSAEYMLLFLVSLSLLGVSVASLGMIKESAEHSVSSHSFQLSAVSLANAVNSACAMGEGNTRPFRLSEPVEITSEYGDGWLLKVSGNDASIVKNTLCEAESASLEEGAFYVENVDGVAHFREQ